MEPAMIQEVCRGFVFSLKGSKEFLQLMQPRLVQMLDKFSSYEICYMIYAFWKKNCLNKKFGRMLEEELIKTLQDPEKTKDVELLALIVNVVCKSRNCSREFQKLMEITVLQRLNDID